MKLFLIVAKGKQQGMPIPIKIDLFMIGTEKVCQLRCQKRRIGDRHCALITRQNKVFIHDMDSGEATLVNGEVMPPGAEWPLHAGDRLTIGPMQFLVQFREKPLSQRDLEEWALKCLDHADESHHLELDEDDPFRVAQRQADNAAQAAAAILDMMQARRGIVKGRLRVGQDGAVTVVRFNDVYLVEESEIALVKKELLENLTRANLRVLLDCKNVRRFSSAAAEMLLEVHNWLRNRGSSVAICRVRTELQPILTQLHILERIKLFNDKKVALAGRW